MLLLFIFFTIGVCWASISNRDSYDIAESREYALYSGLAYCPKKCLDAWSCEAAKNLTNFVDVVYVNNPLTLASCFIGYENAKNKIIVSFRGSANIQNVIEDIHIQKAPYNCKGCEIHAGFLSDYLVIESRINEVIADLLHKHPTASIVATGHSLGGALSEIGGMRLKAKFGVKTVVHNYGCPRVGNAAMAQYIGTRVDTLYRVVHNKDIVPHFPSQRFQYSHSAFEVFWDEEMTSYVICNESGEDKNCSNKFNPQYNFSDHHFYFVKIIDLAC